MSDADEAEPPNLGGSSDDDSSPPTGDDPADGTEQVALADLEAGPHATVFAGAEPKTVRLRLRAGEGIAAHTHPGRDVVFHVLDGRIDLTLDGETRAVAAGELVRFPGEREVAPTAASDAAALVVFAPRADG